MWGVFVAAERDGDGQPVYLRVQPSDGGHVAQSDADWLWDRVNFAPSVLDAHLATLEAREQRDDALHAVAYLRAQLDALTNTESGLAT